MVSIVKETSDLSDYQKEGVTKIGKIAVEAMVKNGKYDKMLKSLSEKFHTDISKETITVAETDLFTTAIAGFIEKRLRPDLVAAQVIKVIDNFQTRGQNALKIPLRSQLVTAADLPDSGLLAYTHGTYESTTITLTYKYAAQQITHEILKFGNVDLIAEELGEIGDALARKLDSDIIAALKAATTTAGGNATSLGTGTYITYAALVAGLNSAKQNYAKPDVLLLNPSTTATIMVLDQFAGGTSLVGSLMFKGDEGTHFPLPQMILNMRVVESLQVDEDDIYLIDTQRTGYLVKSGDIETFDGRISGYLSYEVIGALNYGVGIVQPKSCYRIEERMTP